jgi:hypothetical protein
METILEPPVCLLWARERQLEMIGESGGGQGLQSGFHILAAAWGCEARGGSSGDAIDVLVVHIEFVWDV